MSAGRYDARVPEGPYELFVQSAFWLPPNPNAIGSGHSPPVSRTAIPNTILSQDFSFPYRRATIPLELSGFYDNDDLTAGWAQLLPATSWIGAAMDFIAGQSQIPVSDGVWTPNMIYFRIDRAAEQAYAILKKFPAQDDQLPQLVVNGSVPEFTYPTQTFHLVESKVYFDAIEAEGDPQLLVEYPSASARKLEYNADGSARYSLWAEAGRTQVGSTLASLTLIAEPGEYALRSKAVVNGTLVAMPETTIIFGEPVSTPPGEQQVVWTPDTQQDLQVSLDFGGATAGGVSSVVKTEQGPTIPEGFSTLCSPNPDSEGACPTLYYDIRTTIPHGSEVEVCIRQAYTSIAVGELEGVLDALRLFHFKQSPTCDPHLPQHDPGSCWEQLPAPLPPTGKPAVTNCAANLAVCGCTSSVECGISQGVEVIQLCGMTSSFSPFTVLKAELHTFATTGSGAQGTIHSWTAPRSGVYRVNAVGAKGGAGTNSPSLSGGCGADVEGELALTEGQVLQILVGQKGGSTPFNGGGGGGSFVVRNGSPLIVAGGGGGVRHAAAVNGRNANLTANGVSGSTTAGYTGGFVAGGTNGRGGNRAVDLGSGGGGWSGNGGADGGRGEGGFAFLAPGINAGRGGRGLACDGPPYADGGFGGGGAGNGCYGGGGGGGYSGGGGGRVAGGGGSWNSGANPRAGIRCTADGNGRVELEWLRP